jgi:hypothetical protein
MGEVRQARPAAPCRHAGEPFVRRIGGVTDMGWLLMSMVGVFVEMLLIVALGQRVTSRYEAVTSRYEAERDGIHRPG